MLRQWTGSSHTAVDLDEFAGKVKSIHVEIEEHEFTTHFMDLGNRYKRHPFQTSQFDRDGKKLEKFNYRTDGVALPKTTYSYDENGVLLKESHYSAVSGQPYLETIYVYDPQGRLKFNDEIGSVESTKAVTDFFSPLSGEIIEVNSGLIDNPSLLNQDPYTHMFLS